MISARIESKAIYILTNWYLKKLLPKKNDLLKNCNPQELVLTRIAMHTNWKKKWHSRELKPKQLVCTKFNYKTIDIHANWIQNNWYPEELLQKNWQPHELKPKQLVSTRFNCKSNDIHANWIQYNWHPQELLEKNRTNWNQNNWYPQDLHANQLISTRTESKTTHIH